MMLTPTVLLRLLGLLIVMGASATLDAQPARVRAEEYARTAIALIDSGQIDRAIGLLDSAIALDPKQISYRYEKSYAYLLKEDYRKGLATIEPTLSETGATELFFQLAAAHHGVAGDTASARAVLRRGIERFPSAGALYADLGNLDAAAGEYERAVISYENGIVAQPSYPENYYRAALILMSSSEPIWGIVYGETFMNLERQTERTTQIGELLVRTYRGTISADGDSTFAVRFSDKTATLQVSGSGDPKAMMELMSRPEWLYEMTAMQALSVSDHCRKQGLTLDCLNQFRTEFTRRWFNQKLEEKFPSRLFEWHRLLLDLGYLDEYNYWLLGAGAPEEFYAWVEANPETFDLFQKWFRVNGMSMR
jgi:tetratricopeptide (TPR) repeat protein